MEKRIQKVAYVPPVRKTSRYTQQETLTLHSGNADVDQRSAPHMTTEIVYGSLHCPVCDIKYATYSVQRPHVGMVYHWFCTCGESVTTDGNPPELTPPDIERRCILLAHKGIHVPRAPPLL